ncbi:MAG: (2Fe-2S)-binding protein, partial [Hyphomicrobiales bacterium]
MFKTAPRLDPGGPTVRFHFEGRELQAREGITLAAALLANGETNFRESVTSGAPRGPFCLMGACFECLV